MSAAVTLLTRGPAAELAEKQLFAPLGIRNYEWTADPGGGEFTVPAPRQLRMAAGASGGSVEA